ncbi:MAG: rhamnan synthesis F family protein [Janthinobacterium lividum]
MRRLLPSSFRSRLGVLGRRAFADLAGPLQPAVASGRVLAICHCHYPDLVPELATQLLSLPRGAELHVSSSDTAVFGAWDIYRARSRVPIVFHPVENRGRDMLPFFTVARNLALRPDAAILKIHGKRSAYSDRGNWWRRDTLRGLIPGPFAAQRALARFAAEPRLALIGAPGSFTANAIYWGGNRAAVTRLMQDITGRATREEDLGFVAGSMFWIRGAYLTELLPHIDEAAFPPEPIDQDGTYPHAIERVIGMAALARDWQIGETGRAAPLTREAARERTVDYI